MPAKASVSTRAVKTVAALKDIESMTAADVRAEIEKCAAVMSRESSTITVAAARRFRALVAAEAEIGHFVADHERYLKKPSYGVSI